LDGLIVSTLDRVLQIVSTSSGVKLEKLNARAAIDQDVRIFGDDIDVLAQDLYEEFGGDIAQWPWHRFCDLNEPHALTGLWFIWRLISWPIRGRLSDPAPYERLELGHIAAVIEKGEWFEP
jgi:hypothetical protein